MPIVPSSPRPLVVTGLDLSLRGTGVAVVVPSVWELRLRNVATARFGWPLDKLLESTGNDRPLAEVRRRQLIAGDVVHLLADHGTTHVFVEGFSFGRPNQAHQLGELAGVVKHELYVRLGLTCVPIQPSTVRRYLLGRFVMRGSKDAVARVLAQMEAPFRGDEGDAFAVANAGLAILGLPFITAGRGVVE